MAFSPVMVSNNFLKLAFEEKSNITPMKLQKLLFFAAAEYAKKTGQPLLDEAFQPWRYGPVVRSVYDEFRSFGGDPIRAYGKNAAGKAYRVDETRYADFADTIERVWNSCRRLSAVEVSRITHLRDSAWHKATMAGSRFISDEEIANDETYRHALHLD